MHTDLPVPQQSVIVTVETKTKTDASYSPFVGHKNADDPASLTSTTRRILFTSKMKKGTHLFSRYVPQPVGHKLLFISPVLDIPTRHQPGAAKPARDSRLQSRLDSKR